MNRILMDNFYTCEDHNIPARMDITRSDSNEAIAYLKIFGQGSDKFQKRVKATLGDDNFVLVKGSEKYIELEIDQISALIESWSFDELCNEENKNHFLRNAPAIRNQINEFAGNESNFIRYAKPEVV